MDSKTQRRKKTIYKIKNKLMEKKKTGKSDEGNSKNILKKEKI